MGTFHYDVMRPAVSEENPMGADGFAFVEFADAEPGRLGALFELMGFKAVARHRTKAVTLYRQGDVNYLVNADPDSYAARFAKIHGPSACGMGFRVADAQRAYLRATAMGAKPAPAVFGPRALNIPAIEGVGGALIYFVDRYGDKGSTWNEDFELDRGPRAGTRGRRAALSRSSDP